MVCSIRILPPTRSPGAQSARDSRVPRASLGLIQQNRSYCNTTCNWRDENRVQNNSTNASLIGTSELALCAFEGLKDMEGVCHAHGERFRWAATSNSTTSGVLPSWLRRVKEVPRYVVPQDERRLTNNPPSVDNVSGTVVYINQSYAQDACVPRARPRARRRSLVHARASRSSRVAGATRTRSAPCVSTRTARWTSTARRS